MVLKKKFQHQPTAIASYDFVDIADGTGTVIYKGAHTKLDTTSDYILTRSDVFSNDIETTATGDSTSFTKRIDVDLDLSVFNMPQRMNGTGHINIPFQITSVPATQRTQSGYVICKLIKNDNEITLATLQSETLTMAAGTDVLNKVALLPFTVTNELFKKGDFIRVTVEGWIKRIDGAGGNGRVTVGHDPQGRDGPFLSSSTVDTTKLEVHAPFIPDL